MVTEEVVRCSGMMWEGWDWGLASSDCLSDFGFGLGDPYEVAGLSTLWNGRFGVVEHPGRSCCHL